MRPDVNYIAPFRDAGLERYFAKMELVPGWLSPLDFGLMAAIDRFQKATGETGDLLEIGVYAGKSSILLGYFLGNEEMLTVCDIFDSSPPPPADMDEMRIWYSSAPRRSAFEIWYRAFHPELPHVIDRPSTSLSKRDFPCPVRLTHVDGSHIYETVKSDLAFARTVGTDRSVVVIDDFSRAHALGVAAASWGYIYESDLRLVAVTDGKAYAHWNAGLGKDLRTHIERWGKAIGVQIATYTIRGEDVLYLREAPSSTRTFNRLLRLLVPPAIPGAIRRSRRWHGRHELTRTDRTSS